MESQLLLYEVRDSVCYLTLNNVAKANSLTADLLSQLQNAIGEANHNEEITCIVLTANGKYFCTGMDLSSSGQAIVGDATDSLSQKRYQTFHDLFESISASRKTTIAFVNGSSYGGGTGLAFACDIRVVVADARFVLSEVKRGLTAAVISRYIVREWGPSFAREAMITGRAVKPSELATLGAVHHIVPDIEQGWQVLGEVVGTLRHCAPRAAYQSKRLVNALYENTLEKGESLIKEVFVDMSRPSLEAAYGVEAYQKGNRNVDWARWVSSRNSSKL